MTLKFPSLFLVKCHISKMGGIRLIVFSDSSGPSLATLQKRNSKQDPLTTYTFIHSPVYY